MSKTYHFIGIGGVGMGKLASMLLKKGVSVTGSDIRASAMTEALQEQGAKIAIGHDAANISSPDYVVFSSAIHKDNPELMKARQLNIEILHRAQLLNHLMQGYTRIAIAGAHGKTTTTAMVGKILQDAGRDPTIALGGVMKGGSQQITAGESDLFVAEVDESDGSFLQAYPRYAVVTNMDREHLDHYPDWEDILSAFKRFFEMISSDGCAVFCNEDPHLRALVSQLKVPQKSYGLSSSADLWADAISIDGMCSSFFCMKGDMMLGKVSLQVPGMHNILNALGAILLTVDILGVDFDVAARSLFDFRGVHRRFEIKGEVNGIKIIDDYGHHPTEIRATLQAARNLKNKRIVTVFQPHRFSRTHLLMEEFSTCFLGVTDELFITDIYAASEMPIEGVHAQVLCDRIKRQGSLKPVYVPRAEVLDKVTLALRPGDLVVTLGAGDITAVSNQLYDHLRK
ncbi:MAG TPA: UDP-N-acetylmuramate--L-alanine ligase [Candidatus Omnitrophota bacterium]|nr:UDP-N-acetylmuramate--L-alanine ligase [Candidatus Omnitrophota bacterium]